jgi:ORF6N domain
MPKKSKSQISIEQIDAMIRMIRGVRVILDRDLAKIYGVPTFRFNEAIERNRHRFPADFMFQLTRAEFDSLKSQIAMSKPENSSQNAMSRPGRGGRRTLPYAFTEHGALQAANVLRSPRAVQMNTTCGDAVGWTALSVGETGERSGERESTFS